MKLLLESKRDNLILPYYEIIQSKGVNISFGKFKSILLEHLTQNGGLRNLSLASNYYLAGAARYYFNGDLTENKDLALYYNFIQNAERTQATDAGQTLAENHTDIWKKDVCKRLNVLIKILRNAYIETIGTQFEQPEDFGTLSIQKLLRKYNKKIDKELGIDAEDEKEDILDYSENVGNGYTFEIIYSYEDCRKYYEATQPGAWCITYGEGNYNWYIRDLGIHYVIFRQNGYENVQRIPNKKKWKFDKKHPKPQDEYGNSLIALLQSNTSPNPVYITSRYNHGAGDTGEVEADHAYTTEEFMKITGVSAEELSRIYSIWRKNCDNIVKSRADINNEKKELILKIKEAQMRINGGENILNVFYVNEFIVGNLENIKKAVFSATLKENNDYIFLVDKGKVVFETIGNFQDVSIHAPYNDTPGNFNNIAICDFTNGSMIYDLRLHKIIDIDGIHKFKSIPTSFKSKFEFYEVKTSHTNIALINMRTNIPLKLPNGRYWFNEIHLKSDMNSYYSHGNKVRSFLIGDAATSLLEIVYDSSSREKYFYNVHLKKFIEIPDYDGPAEYRPENSSIGDKLEPIVGNICLGPNFYTIRYCCNANNSRWDGFCTPYEIFTKNGERLECEGEKFFTDATYLGDGYFALVKYSEDKRYNIPYYSSDKRKQVLFNFYTKENFKIQGMDLEFERSKVVCNNSADKDGSRIIYLIQGSYGSNSYTYLFDKQVKKFVFNTYGFPTQFVFKRYMDGTPEGTHLSFYRSDSPFSWDTYEEGLFKISFVEGISYMFKNYIYPDDEGKENEERYNIRPIKYIE